RPGPAIAVHARWHYRFERVMCTPHEWNGEVIHGFERTTAVPTRVPVLGDHIGLREPLNHGSESVLLGPFSVIAFPHQVGVCGPVLGYMFRVFCTPLRLVGPQTVIDFGAALVFGLFHFDASLALSEPPAPALLVLVVLV